MSKKQSILIITFCLLATLTAIAQPEKKPLTNADIISMLDAGLSESTIVLTIQQSQPNFDTSPQALIKLKNKTATPKILDAILQAQAKVSTGITNADSTVKTEESLAPVMVILDKPKPKILAKDFSFELQSCKKSGQTIICQLSITNESDEERPLWIFVDSQIFDENGQVSKTTKVGLGNKNDNYSVGFGMISGISVKATVTFSEIKTNFSKIKLFRIWAGTPDDPKNKYRLAAKTFPVDLKDIDISKSK